jgi:hypothetical protein
MDRIQTYNQYCSVVEQNLTTALIIEDDADWDVRIKQQLIDFSVASRALVQPSVEDSTRYADPTFPKPASESDEPTTFDFQHLPLSVSPRTSPYGDNWDILWLGHCGMRFPEGHPQGVAQESKNTPRGQVIKWNDVTVPEPQHLLDHEDALLPVVRYPPHSRVVHHHRYGVCSLAYAVTQKTARQMLYDMGIKVLEAPFDLMLRYFCQGTETHDAHTCITVQPQLFNHHRPAGKTAADSDINDPNGDKSTLREKASTKIIRWSTRLNLPKLLRGERNFEDQYPDSPKLSQ